MYLYVYIYIHKHTLKICRYLGLWGQINISKNISKNISNFLIKNKIIDQLSIIMLKSMTFDIISINI